MNRMSIYDILEQLIKTRSISKQLIMMAEDRHRDILISVIRHYINEGVLEEVEEELRLLKPVDLLISLPSFNLTVDRFSPYIEWYEFEEYISRVFTEFGWDVYLNYVHTRVERFQIDVIALNDILRLSVFIECKHWRNASRIYTGIDKIVNEHIKRIEKYLRNCEWVCTRITRLRSIAHILPVIIVIYDLPMKIVKGVPIVPLSKLRDFIINIDSYADALNLVLYKNRCYVK